MKSILIIGMGRFGHHLCENLAMLGNDVMVVDQKEEVLEDLLPIVTSAKIGDCTNEAVLRSLGIANFDICFVCIGTNFQSSLEITSLVKELGGRRVISKANRDIHAKFLLRNGADEVIYPERDMAIHGAVKYASNHVRDFIQLSDEYSIYETSVPPQWVGKSILDLEVRKKYHLNILAIKREEQIDPEVNPNYQFTGQEMVFLMGSRENMRPFL